MDRICLLPAWVCDGFHTSVRFEEFSSLSLGLGLVPGCRFGAFWLFRVSR